MTPAAPRPELEPLESVRLMQRLPHLREAMDTGLMQVHLQRCFFDGGEFVVVACEPPRAELSEGACSLQYPLHLRTASHERREVIVHGTMFSEAGAAALFERIALFPQAAAWRAELRPAHPVTGVIAHLNVAASVLPVNASLPTLTDVMDPVRITPVVRDLLGDDAAVVDRIGLVVFRRTRGCVLRMHLQAAGHGIVYGKVGYSAASAAARSALDALAQRARSDTASSLFLPRYIGRSDAFELTLVAAMPGGKPDLRTQAGMTVDAAGRLAALLHGSGVTVGARRTLDDEVGRASQAVGEVREDTPLLAGWLSDALTRAKHRARGAPAGEVVFAHGDFTPSQLMLDGERAGVLDFDKLCQAEPALDLGRFLAYLRCALCKYGNVAGEGLAANFLATYAATGAELPAAARIDGYEIASLVRMAARSWLQLKPARLRVVCAVLEKRLASLE